jgi:hypothetical protein
MKDWYGQDMDQIDLFEEDELEMRKKLEEGLKKWWDENPSEYEWNDFNKMLIILVMVVRKNGLMHLRNYHFFITMKIVDPKQMIMWRDEPRIPRCNEICGLFIINANQFIRKIVTYMVNYSNEIDNGKKSRFFLVNSVCVWYGKFLKEEIR